MIQVIVQDKLVVIKKMKKDDLVKLCGNLMADVVREMDDYTIRDVYDRITCL